MTAPLLPWLLEDSFLAARDVARGLAWLPFLQVLRGLLNFHVIHHGHMTSLGWAYAIGALVNITAVWLLVPRWGMNGAFAPRSLSGSAMTLHPILGNFRR